ncbi:MAG: glycosyltransferase family 39 protein [Acidipila sp.]|nr:glycosyltransferase family 39 protein [Acidipila sp.]
MTLDAEVTVDDEMTLDDGRSFPCRSGIAWILLGALLLGAGSLLYPWTERDSASAAYIGARILEGQAPYRDAWNVKGPGINFAYALSNLFFGKSAAGLRVFDLLWQTATALLLALATTRIYKNASMGRIAALVYLTAYFSQNYWNWGEADGLLSLPLAMALLFAVRAQENERLLFWMLAGVGVGIATLFKSPWGLFGLAILVAALAQEGRRVDRAVRRPAALAAGFGLSAATAGIYLFWKNALTDFWTTQFLLATEYVARLRAVASAKCVMAAFVQPVHTPLILIAAIGLWSMVTTAASRKRLSPPELLLLAWMFIAAFTLVMHGAYLAYDFLPFFAPLAILCAPPIYAAGKAVREKRRSAAWLALAALALVVPAKKIGQHYAVAVNTLRGRVEPGVWNTLGTFLNQRTAPQDRIFVWGNAPVIYLYADRLSSSRFIQTWFLTIPWRHVDYRPVFLAEFAAHRPRYFVLLKAEPEQGCAPLFPGSQETFEQFAALRNIVAEEYQVEKDEPLFRIYRQKQPGSSP